MLERIICRTKIGKRDRRFSVRTKSTQLTGNSPKTNREDIPCDEERPLHLKLPELSPDDISLRSIENVSQISDYASRSSLNQANQRRD